LKIAWFSPLPPQKSGISDYSELILNSLKDYAQVDLWVDGSPSLEFYKKFKIIDYSGRWEAMLPLLKSYDIVVYNIGNNPDFHLSMYYCFLDFPGIVILHDYVLHHFMAGLLIGVNQDIDSYFAEVRKQYGSVAEMLARKSVKPGEIRLWESDDVFNFPLNKNVLQKAQGVIVHSEFIKSLIKQDTSGEVLTLNMPYFEVSPEILAKTRQELGLPQDKIIIASFGFMTPNKRIDKVLDAIAKEPCLREKVCYLLLGHLDTSLETSYDLKQLIVEKGLAEVVRTFGYLPIEEALAYLNCSDICINLRYPTMGETSASLVRMMSLGKPTVVTRVGWYGDLPDDVVMKIDYGEREVDALAECLLRLVNDIDRRQNFGAAAVDYVKKNHSLGLFLKNLMKYFERHAGQDSSDVYRHLLDKITDIMLEFDGDTVGLPSQIAKHLTWTLSNQV
jgi:glycosyltransferase involved in cell wall biosynthesis